MADILDEYANARPLTDSEWDAVRLIPLLGKDRGEGRWINQLVATVADLRERLASLQAQRDNAQRHADLHMNAASVYQREIATLEAQLALRDAVVEAARRSHCRVPHQMCACGLSRAGCSIFTALAALDASENPRGATP